MLYLIYDNELYNNTNIAGTDKFTSLVSISSCNVLFQRCGPCKLIEPVLEQCAEDWKNSVVVGKFDVEDTSKSRNLKVELILQGAMPQALPALILVHNNKILDT